MMLALKNINFAFENNLIFQDLSYEFKKNACYLITGNSGSGKSTLGLIASGLLEPNQGTVLCNDNKPLYEVAYMFQNPDLQFCMATVFDELIFVLENMQVTPSNMHRQVDEALVFSEILHLKHRELHSLSIGEKQSVSLACIYLLGKDFVILDEPFANIDEKKTQSLLQKLYKLHKLHKTSLIFIDHEFAHYFFEFEKILFLQDQKLKEIKTVPKKYLPKLPNLYVDPLPYIKLENVQIEIGGHALFLPLNEIIYKGSLVAITGESGAGKTSLLYALLGVRKYKGKITYQDKKYRPRKIKLGFVFQNPMDQFIASTVYDEVYSSCLDHQKTSSILDYLNLSAYKNLSPFKLSQGQQRRLALGIILMGDFDLIIMDEPTYGQDHALVIKIMNQLRTVAADAGKTILFTSHDLELVEHYASHIIKVKKHV